MTGPTIVSGVTSLAIDAIEVGERLRPTTEAAVAALEFVIAEYGFTVPVLVRKVRSGFRLIDGAHRLAAMKRRGAAEIAVVAVACTDDEARVLEASQNLAGAALSPLDESLFLAAFGDAYQKLHPETKRGAAGALAKHGLATELRAFAEVIAEKRSITPRQVRKIAAAGRLITRRDAESLRAAPRKLTLKDIQDFGKIGDPDDRARVVSILVAGNARSVTAARRQIKGEGGVSPAVKDPVEAEFKALSTAWVRAGVAARKRFLLEYAKEVWRAQNAGPALPNWREAAE